MKSNLFKWKHYESSIIILCIRWYFNSACSFIAGVETLHMISKGQAGTSNITDEVILINQLFGIA